ncbi:fatty acid hydroxylase [Diaporthe sp. PMI_573]|nr:fatty acid hydroxylase [Diaporthaceae sp. PMI_573]
MASIPGPPPLPLIGNLRDIDLANSIRSFCDIAARYRPIVKIRLGRAEPVFVTGHELANELCSRKDFVKFPAGAVRNLKVVMPEGLFTADHGEEFWEIAHRVLVPAFGPMSVRTMFPETYDIVTQMSLRWARFGEDEPIDATADFTRLTLDTIALLHPFVDSMIRLLTEAANRSGLPAWLTWMQWSANKKFDEDNAYLHEVASDLLEKRRANPTDKKDLLNETLRLAKTLSEDTIIDNMITFLIAGHETTAGLLSFLFALLLQHPEAYRKLQQEVYSVVGGAQVTADHLNQLLYVKACLRETLRLNFPSVGFSVSFPGEEDASEPILLGGKWLVKRNQPVFVLLPGLHRDPTASGDDADEFKPERMLEDNFKKLPPGPYKPFGNGLRGCIGSEFAMQGAILAVAVLFQKFEFKLKDPNYKLTWKQTLTLKPLDLFKYAKRRTGIDPLGLQRDLFHGTEGGLSFPPGTEKMIEHADVESGLVPMSIFYGSNTGTCESLASRLAMTALQHGFRCNVDPLDKARDNIPKDRPVVIITSTMYEGQAPDNGERFVEWLENGKDVSKSGVEYAVFGCGSSDWNHTYQKIAVQVDERMEERGARPLTQRGVADEAEGNVTGDFDTWMQDSLWPVVSRTFPTGTVDATTETVTNRLDVPVPCEHTDAIEAGVVEVKALTELEDQPKYHMEIKLPAGAAYEVGDYLEVYPHNIEEEMDSLLQVMRAQGYDLSDPLISTMHSRLELHQPASVKQFQSLVEKCTDPEDRIALQQVSAQAPSTTDKRPSILQLLRHYPSIKLPLDKLATMLPPLRPRQYSILSSPLVEPSSLKLTWSLITRGPPASLPDEPPTRGLASHYLAGLKPGDTLKWSGIAPFRAFIEHRTELLRRQPDHHPPPLAVLYAGHRSPEHAPYASELKSWRAAGVVDVRYAYSRGGAEAGLEGPAVKGRRVQDRIWEDRSEFWRLWKEGARVYVCGGRGVSYGVREVVRRIYMEQAEKRYGVAKEADVEAWWVEALREKFVVEVF